MEEGGGTLRGNLVSNSSGVLREKVTIRTKRMLGIVFYGFRVSLVFCTIMLDHAGFKDLGPLLSG